MKNGWKFFAKHMWMFVCFYFFSAWPFAQNYKGLRIIKTDYLHPCSLYYWHHAQMNMIKSWVIHRKKKTDSLTPLLSLNIFIDPWCICENLSLLMGEKLTKGLQKEETWKGSNRRKERKWAVTKSKIVESSSHTRNESQHSINSTCKN